MNTGLSDSTPEESDAELERIYAILRTHPAPLLPSMEELLADARSLGVLHTDPPVHPIIPSTCDPVHSKFTKRPHYAPLACAAAAVVASLLLVAHYIPLPSAIALTKAEVYATAPGEQSTLTLKDGSDVTLGASTELQVLFSKRSRLVLLTRGEAFFRVKHDPQAPSFEVLAGAGRIKDLGTSFDVHHYVDHVEVSVTEGTVIVSPSKLDSANTASAATSGSAEIGASRTSVRAGQTVSYAPDSGVSRPRAADTKAVTSWVSGRRVYKSQPLSRVIEDVQRYSARKIEFDAALGAENFTGYIIQSQAEQWVLGLDNIFDVSVNADSRRLFIHCHKEGCAKQSP